MCERTIRCGEASFEIEARNYDAALKDARRILDSHLGLLNVDEKFDTPRVQYTHLYRVAAEHEVPHEEWLRENRAEDLKRKAEELEVAERAELKRLKEKYE